MAKIIILVAMLLHLLSVSFGVTYYAGDAVGWTHDKDVAIDYTDWSNSKHFLVGDYLIFKYDKTQNNVVMVRSENFEDCNAADPIAVYNSGHDTILLGKAGDLYFFSSLPGNCQFGQKVHIKVSDPSPSPTPAPVVSVAPSPAEHKQTPTPAPAPAEHKHTPAPAPAPAPAEHKQTPAPAPADHKQTPSPAPAQYATPPPAGSVAPTPAGSATPPPAVSVTPPPQAEYASPPQAESYTPHDDNVPSPAPAKEKEKNGSRPLESSMGQVAVVLMAFVVAGFAY